MPRGVASKVDVALAQTLLKTTQAQAIDIGVQRAQLEHAIAVLIGKPPSDVLDAGGAADRRYRRRCRWACPRNCSSAGRTSLRPSGASRPRTRRSAWPTRPTTRPSPWVRRSASRRPTLSKWLTFAEPLLGVGPPRRGDRVRRRPATCTDASGACGLRRQCRVLSSDRAERLPGSGRQPGGVAHPAKRRPSRRTKRSRPPRSRCG